MLDQDWLSDLLCNPKIKTSDKILTVLLDGEVPEKTASEIKGICIAHGASDAEKWSLSGFLHAARKQGKVKQVSNLWSLTPTGRAHLKSEGLLPPELESHLAPKRDELRKSLARISDANIRSFIEEAIGCLEAKHLRAAVITSWIGAVALLYDHVIANYLVAFNSEATRRNPKWKPATDADGFARMKESDFLDILEAINVVGHSVKVKLQSCLNERNACGHPNSYQLGEQAVAAHIEGLILNVYSKFP